LADGSRRAGQCCAGRRVITDGRVDHPRGRSAWSRENAHRIRRRCGVPPAAPPPRRGTHGRRMRSTRCSRSSRTTRTCPLRLSGCCANDLPRDVQRALARLPAREWEILRRRFGFEGREEHPPEEAGVRLALTAGRDPPSLGARPCAVRWICSRATGSCSRVAG
jgi:hypothetical protein